MAVDFSLMMLWLLVVVYETKMVTLNMVVAVVKKKVSCETTRSNVESFVVYNS